MPVHLCQFVVRKWQTHYNNGSRQACSSVRPNFVSIALGSPYSGDGKRLSRPPIMFRFIQHSTILVIAMYFVGCTSPARKYRTDVLSLPYSEFDQAYGDGWRSFFEAGDAATAATLLEQYLELHKELTFGQRKFLHLHAGQLWALEGKNTRAVKHLEKAMSHQQSRERWPDWDDFIAATMAFLMRDRPALLAARERLAGANAPRVKLADRFIQKFGQSSERRIMGSSVWSGIEFRAEPKS
jgi:hypothetical protein